MIDRTTKKKLKRILQRGTTAVIITHKNPDGDAIGSSCAMGMYLRKKGLSVNIIIPNEVPAFLKWIPGCEMVTVYKTNEEACNRMIGETEILFFLDFNDPERISDMKDQIMQAQAYKILIDHHQGPVQFTDTTISETWRGSVGEMIYEVIRDLGDRKLMDKDIATCLYVAIMTDTGNFRYSSSYPGIFNIVGELMHYEIDKDIIFTNIYDSYSEKRMKMLGFCLLEKMVILPEYRTAYISLTREEMKRFDHQIGDTEGFVNVPFSISGIRFTALFIEKHGLVKASFRSKGSFPVSSFSEKHFNGGGHVNAAGGEINLSLEETLKKFEGLLEEYKEDLLHD